VQDQREQQLVLHLLDNLRVVQQVQKEDRQQLGLLQVEQLQGLQVVHHLQVVHLHQGEQVHKEDKQQLGLLQVEQLQELHQLQVEQCQGLHLQVVERQLHQLRQLLAHRHKKDRSQLQL